VGVGEEGVGVEVTSAPFVEPSVVGGVALAMGKGFFMGLGNPAANAKPQGVKNSDIKRKLLFNHSSRSFAYTLSSQ
jgi:hypothetical protein